MTDLPPDSPIDLCALVLYNIYRKKTAEKSYESYKKLCEIMGKKAISYEDFENWFKKYSKENGRDLPIPDIRGCIFSDVIIRKSSEKSIDDLCHAFKNSRIDEKDHDYWFKRFENGHLFRSVTFSDLPEDFIAEIVGKCDLKSRLNLRNVTHGLRTIVDQRKPPYKTIEICVGEKNIIMNFDDEELTYSSGDYKKFAFEDLQFVLKNPKLRLKSLNIKSVDFYWIPRDELMKKYEGLVKLFNHFFNTLNHKIHVEQFLMKERNHADVLDILKCLKPGVLESIVLKSNPYKPPWEIWNSEKLVEMEQWKQAKHMEIRRTIFAEIENFFHFKTLRLGVKSISAEELAELCNGLSKSTSFESCTIETEDWGRRVETIKRELELQQNSSPDKYSIPETNLTFEFVFKPGRDFDSYIISKN